MEDSLHKLKSLEIGYKPSRETADSIKDKKLFAFIGAFAVGKSTLISAIVDTNKGFSEVISFTTRPPRDMTDNYRFIDHNESNIDKITKRTELGELVNIAVHPTTGHVYGTEVMDYKTDFNILATTASNFSLSTSKLPFKQVKPIAIVAEADTWVNRIGQRATSKKDLLARLSEAKQSLEWSLDQEDIMFIDNTSRLIGVTAMGFMKKLDSSYSKSKNEPRIIATGMLKYIKNIDI